MGHGSNDVTVAAALLRVPSATAFDYEWATVQHNVNCRLARAVVVPDAIPPERLERYGARGKVRPYEGLKEEYYLADFEPDEAVLERAGPGPRAADRGGAHPARGVALPPLREPAVPRRAGAPEGRRAGRGAAAHARSAARGGGARRPDRARACDRRAEPDRAVGPRDLRRRYHEPRGGGARHPRLHHFRGSPGRRRRAADARRPAAQARGSRPGAASRSAPCTTPTASAAIRAKW